MTAAYFITLQYVPEIFPTAVRGQGIALAETMGGAAIFVSPLIVHLVSVMLFYGKVTHCAFGLHILSLVRRCMSSSSYDEVIPNWPL